MVEELVEIRGRNNYY